MAFEKILEFYSQKDSEGITNIERIEKNQKVMRRTADTPKDKSFEFTDGTIYEDYPTGMVVLDGKLIGLGIHIYNEDIYPLQHFEIYLRNCGLTGSLELTGCEDMVFLDVYSNEINKIVTGSMPAMRIFGVQNNCLEELDVSGMPACQGIDAGKNKIGSIDVSANLELVELYINDNEISDIDLSANEKIKYFYCQNNRLEVLDAKANPLLRHLNATGNPLKEIKCMAPQNPEGLPLELHAGEGGHVGLRFNPVYNAQWKETGEWEQCYFAYPLAGYDFKGWTDEAGNCLSTEEEYHDQYGAGRILTADFMKHTKLKK